MTPAFSKIMFSISKKSIRIFNVSYEPNNDDYSLNSLSFNVMFLISIFITLFQILIIFYPDKFIFPTYKSTMSMSYELDRFNIGFT